MHFRYVHAMILTMRQIPLGERPGREKNVAPFLKKQTLICDQFGINVPEEYADTYTSAEIKPKRKRGRPRKQDT